MRMNGRHMLAGALATALVAMPLTGATQDPSADAPIAWGAETVIYEGDALTLAGKVELVQGENRLRADRVTGLNQSGQSVIRATGDIFYVTPDATIRGDAATYDTAAGTIVVTGEVILTQGQNVATGSRLTYQVRSGDARLEGASTPNGRRVQGVFYPSGND